MNLDRFNVRYDRFLQSPVWYIAIIAGLSGLTFRFGYLGWLVIVMALVWGAGLIWYQFSHDGTSTGSEDRLQGYLRQSLLYKTQIDQALQAATAGRNLAQRQALGDQVDIWVVAIHDLVQRLANLQADGLIRDDLTAVPQAAAALQAQLASETDAAVRIELRRALANRQNQLMALEHLQRTMRQAEIQIENTLSLLGTIYPQILTGQSTNHVADYARLATNIEEEVHCLQDQLEALWEVKGGYRVMTNWN